MGDKMIAPLPQPTPEVQFQVVRQLEMLVTSINDDGLYSFEISV
jgi:hypothetical protein